MTEAKRTITLYTRPGCRLCDEASVLLTPLCRQLGLKLERRNVEADYKREERYGARIPVVELDGEEILAWPFSRLSAERTLKAALAAG